MIITISGTPGSGKSTTAKELAKKFNLKHYSTGDFMRDMARERNMSINELSKAAESDPKIDKALDDRQINLGKKEDNFVIDGRLSFHFIPNAIKIFIDAELDERVKRVVERDGTSDFQKTKQQMMEREASEKKRYKEYYDLELTPDKFDLTIDTTALSKGEVLNTVIKFIKKH